MGNSSPNLARARRDEAVFNDVAVEATVEVSFVDFGVFCVRTLATALWGIAVSVVRNNKAEALTGNG
jgi:hypothetical protein